MLVSLIAFCLPGSALGLERDARTAREVDAQPRRGVPGAEHPAGERHHGDQDQGQGAPRLALSPRRLRPFFGAATFSFLPVQPPRAGCSARAATKCCGDLPPRRSRHVRGPRRAGGRRRGPAVAATSRRRRRRLLLVLGRSASSASPWPRRLVGVGLVGRPSCRGRSCVVGARRRRRASSVSEEASSGTTGLSALRSSSSTPWTMRLYSSSSRTAPMAFFAKTSVDAGSRPRGGPCRR